MKAENLKRKYYIFRAGQLIPKWMMNFESNDRSSEMRNKHGKIRFGYSCMAVRIVEPELLVNTLILKASGHGIEGDINIKGFENGIGGGINGSTGIMIIYPGTSPMKIYESWNRYLEGEIKNQLCS